MSAVVNVPSAPPTEESLTRNDAAKQTLSGALRKSIATLTEAEALFLRALLEDDSGAVVAGVDKKEEPTTLESVEIHTNKMDKAIEKLRNEEVFPNPKPMSDIELKPPKARRPTTRGLWLAHEDGVHPNQLASKGSRNSSAQHTPNRSASENKALSPSENESSAEKKAIEQNRTKESVVRNESEDDAQSNEEVRPEFSKHESHDDESWGSEDDANHIKHDAWEVLKDEYAEDFGFNFTAPGTASEDDLPNSFQILGTSADDKSVQPHVMSPPMMDALMSFLPENLVGQNFWLRFSLERDGASLDTLKRYVRASECTILAIETPKGEVFGSFTSSAWRTHYGFYGSTPAFVWKLRHNRQTKCTSLFDQAQLESEIDVFMASDSSQNIQVCRHDGIAVGGDESLPDVDEYESLLEALVAAEKSGFAICLDSDLLRGTTSLSSTFHNPSLCGSGDKTEIFDVAGLEVWTLTPCYAVQNAERLEMTKFFVEDSVRSLSSASTPNHSRPASILPEYNLDQDQFYRRIGQDPESESRRDHWQYLNMMNVGGKTNSGLGASPRFGYDKTD